MSRNAAVSQTKRNFNNPLVLGTFSTTSLRYLKGIFKQEHKLIGSADTAFTSNGGYGGGTYNHWFQINLAKPAWIIVTKGPPRPKYIQVSAYDLNRTPIVAQAIFDADSITSGVNNAGGVYIPYLDTVMHGQSDLYNTYNRWRLDRGDDRYYPLGQGSYLICISSTRNEPLAYEVGIVIEFPPTEMFIALEDEGTVSLLLQETAVDPARTIFIECPVTVDTTISNIPEKPNGFTETLCQINSGVTVTVLEGSTWFIGEQIPSAQTPDYAVLAEPASDEYFDTIHDHSISEWQDAWRSQHQDTDRFPEIFAPLANRS
jgi:hypothetical protein